MSKRQIVLRMINNLRAIYFSQQAFAKALLVMNLLIEADPGDADQYKQRGMVHLQGQQMQAAKADLQTYLRMAPDATDRADIEAQVQGITRWVAMLN